MPLLLLLMGVGLVSIGTGAYAINQAGQLVREPAVIALGVAAVIGATAYLVKEVRR